MASPSEEHVPMRKRVAKACETCRAMKSKVRYETEPRGNLIGCKLQLADNTGDLLSSVMGGTRLAIGAKGTATSVRTQSRVGGRRDSSTDLNNSPLVQLLELIVILDWPAR